MSVDKLVADRWIQKLAGVQSKMLRGGDCKGVLIPVWDMYKTSYAKIGLSVSSIQGLLKYDIWEVFFSDKGPIAFNLYKSTSFGLKTGLLGSNGADGKPVIKHHIKARYLRSGVYGEVSHAVERLTANVVTICAVSVPTVLGKPVAPDEDGVHYTRNIQGVGPQRKVMRGTPKGIPPMDGSCPVPDEDVVLPKTASDEDDAFEAEAHMACQLDFE